MKSQRFEGEQNVKQPIFVRNLLGIKQYPKALRRAFNEIFNEDDIVIFYPLGIPEGQSVTFLIVNRETSELHRFSFLTTDFIFCEDRHDTSDFVDFLIEIEQIYRADEILDRINFIEHRELNKDEFYSLVKFYNFSRGVDSYDLEEDVTVTPQRLS